MNKVLKTVITIVALIIIGQILIGLFKVFTGNYFANASFITSGLVVLAGIGAVALIVYGVKKLWTAAAFVVMALFFQSCDYAKSNQQVVVSSDCGMTWKKISIGDAVPTGTGNRCFMKVLMPNHTMQGESRFVLNFKDKVRATSEIDYDYSIDEPIKFIYQAKYLGAANKDADDDAALDASKFEAAENNVIEKRIKDVAKGTILHEDIVDYDQAAIEAKILDESNKILAPIGIHLNFITLTFDLDEQTRQAIDVATAAKIYSIKGLDDVGRAVMSARAGATKVSVTTRNVMPGEKE